MSTQIENGKAFEFALLHEITTIVSAKSAVSILENEPWLTAKKCFEKAGINEQKSFLDHSRKAILFLCEIEPNLNGSEYYTDVLNLRLASDSEGKNGDVRDVIISRPSKNWEIGISAKNNHKAVKHSRLSTSIDFGAKWLGVPCSENYFEQIKPIFNRLDAIRKQDSTTLWDTIPNMHLVIYKPILNAFKSELLRLAKENPKVAQNLVQYLIGYNDFYKVIKGNGKVEIQAYNLRGTLNLPAEVKPKDKVSKLKLPTRLIEIIYEKESLTTLTVYLNEGWTISFRIHNASSRVEPSLKFDINLVSAPQSLFSTQFFVE